MSVFRYTFWEGGRSCFTACSVCWHTAVTQLSQQRAAAVRPTQETCAAAGLRGYLAAQAGVVSPELKQGSLRCTRVKGWLYYPQCFISWMGAGFLFFFLFIFTTESAWEPIPSVKQKAIKLLSAQSLLQHCVRLVLILGGTWRELNCCYSPWSPAVVASMGQRSSIWANRSTIFV